MAGLERPPILHNRHLRKRDMTDVGDAFAGQWERTGDPWGSVSVLRVHFQKKLVSMSCGWCRLRGTPLEFWNSHNPDLCAAARAEQRCDEDWTMGCDMAKRLIKVNKRADGWRATAQAPEGWGRQPEGSAAGQCGGGMSIVLTNVELIRPASAQAPDGSATGALSHRTAWAAPTMDPVSLTRSKNGERWCATLAG